MIRDKIYAIIRDVFAQPALSVSDTTTAADVEGWDSFNHMTLIMRIEEEFAISFATEEIGRMAHVGELIEAVRTKKGVSSA
jgi:acyl carrier protein